MRDRRLTTGRVLTIAIAASIVALACQDVSIPAIGPDAELRASASPRGQQMREGSVIQARMKFTFAFGPQGHQRVITTERLVEGKIQNGRAIGRIKREDHPGLRPYFSTTGDECSDCAAKLDTLFHNFAIELAQISVEDAAYSWSGTDSLGRTHYFVSSAATGSPAHQVTQYVDGAVTMQSNMDWATTSSGWLLRKQDFAGYSDGTAVMTWTATMNQEYTILDSSLRGGLAVADASAAIWRWLLPQTLGAQTTRPECGAERNEVIATSVAFGAVLFKVARQRGIPTSGDLTAGIIASSAWGASVANYRNCRRGGGGGTKTGDEEKPQ
ncbi:MAG: hypothetical protein ABIP09_05855 [Gemmatimonadaceae bacterium]